MGVRGFEPPEAFRASRVTACPNSPTLAHPHRCADSLWIPRRSHNFAMCRLRYSIGSTWPNLRRRSGWRFRAGGKECTSCPFAPTLVPLFGALPRHRVQFLSTYSRLGLGLELDQSRHAGRQWSAWSRGLVDREGIEPPTPEGLGLQPSRTYQQSHTYPSSYPLR